jgi:hypothetical protein
MAALRLQTVRVFSGNAKISMVCKPQTPRNFVWIDRRDKRLWSKWSDLGALGIDNSNSQVTMLVLVLVN